MSESPSSDLRALATQLEAINFAFPAQQDRALRLRNDVVSRINEHLMGRGTDLDAPLIAVLAGSTGVGKSTLLNSIVGRLVPTSVRRPTTLTPVLVHHPDDELWLAGDRVLSGFTRIRLREEDKWEEHPALPETVGELEETVTGVHTLKPELIVRATEQVPPGICLIDCPDLDSYLDQNRQLAEHLLDVADLWIFVTSANRYRDEPGLELLQKAAARDIAVGAVLNRVTQGSLLAAKEDLREEIAAAGLKDVPIFTILESPLDDGELPAEELASLRHWLDNLAGDSLLHSALARQTLFGSLQEVLEMSETVFAAAKEEPRIQEDLRDAVAKLEAELAEQTVAVFEATDLWEGEPAYLLAPCVSRQLEILQIEDPWGLRRLAWKNRWLKQQIHPELAYVSMRKAVSSFTANLDFQIEQIIARHLAGNPALRTLWNDTKPQPSEDFFSDWSLTVEEFRARIQDVDQSRIAQLDTLTLFLAVVFAAFATPQLQEQTRVDRLLESVFSSVKRAEFRVWCHERVQTGLKNRALSRTSGWPDRIAGLPDNSQAVASGEKILEQLREQWS